MTKLAEEAARLVEMLPEDKAQALLEYARYLVEKTDDGSAERSTTLFRNFDQSAAIVREVDQEAPAGPGEIGSIEGILETLSIRGGATFSIREVVTGTQVTCRFADARLDEAQAAFGRRVAAHGRIRYSPSGQPLDIQVERLRQLRDQQVLPQADDLEGIDLTHGIDPSEYVRSLRDAE